MGHEEALRITSLRKMSEEDEDGAERDVEAREDEREWRVTRGSLRVDVAPTLRLCT